MSNFRKETKKIFFTHFGILFVCFSFLTIIPAPVYAAPLTSLEQKLEDNYTENKTTSEKPKAEQQDITTGNGNFLENLEQKLEDKYVENHDVEVGSVCTDQSGAVGWIICPTTGVVAKASDAIYSMIEDILKINPATLASDSTVHIIWQYVRDITNIIFIIFLLVVVISHLTNLGISNYNLKRILPRLIVVAILVNISFVACQLAVDISNILGSSIRDTFYSIEEQAISQGANVSADISWENIIGAVTGTGVITGLGITFTGGLSTLFWALIPALLGAIVSVIIGLITISLRQGLVMVLTMIAPLAFVCFLLPNTEGWFKKWKSLFMKMLTFYPMFSFLFGASHIAGWAIITSSTNEAGETSGFGIIVGLVVQIFPLFGSWSLMKMSGTILGTVNDKLHKISAKPLAQLSLAAENRKLQARQNYLNNSSSIGANARRFVDYRSELRKADTANLKSRYDNDIQRRINKKLQSGYNPINPDTSTLRANKYLRNAKQARIAEMRNSTSAKDVSHVLDKYGEYYGKNSTIDKNLGDQSAQSWLDFNRASFTQVADEEADFDYLVQQYIDMNALGSNRNNPYYKYYIHSVSPDGKFNVMGQLINRATAVEQRRRRDYGTMIAKWNFDKRSFRNMAIGYYNNDDGFATDANGNDLGEKQPGQFLETDPSRLVPYDKIDENGRAYFDWYDQGKFVMRVYRDDSAFMKEAFSNYDTIINDPENSLYGILAGVKEGDIMPNDPRFQNIGLSKYATTLGRAILAAGYKEKNVAYSPYMAEMIKNRRIKTTGQNNIAWLDSFIKGAKAGVFLTNDQASLEQYCWLLDPSNFAEAFPDQDIESYQDVNGKSLKGLDADGNKIARELATLEDKKRYLKNDLLMNAMNMMLQMFTKNTPNISENQKTSTKDKLVKLKSTIDKWVETDDGIALVRDIKNKNPYRVTNSSMDSIRSDISDIFKLNQNSSLSETLTEIESFRISASNADEFRNEIVRILSSNRNYRMIQTAFEDYCITNPDASKAQLYDSLIEIFTTFDEDN